MQRKRTQPPQVAKSRPIPFPSVHCPPDVEMVRRSLLTIELTLAKTFIKPLPVAISPQQVIPRQDALGPAVNRALARPVVERKIPTPPEEGGMGQSSLIFLSRASAPPAREPSASGISLFIASIFPR
jgi:hypothetical protein